jgi:hypothetical protein
LLSRNIRTEEDLIDQLFNSSEKRLARTLLLLARYGKQDKPARVVARVSQDTLAAMIGTKRHGSRVNFFLNKFKKLVPFLDSGQQDRQTQITGTSCRIRAHIRLTVWLSCVPFFKAKTLRVRSGIRVHRTGDFRW